uniref:Integrase catalytic domain-containing protein n=1 Tax=Cannabis sativa TaxID=3483 RepID=A0A803PU39_CANSA
MAQLVRKEKNAKSLDISKAYANLSQTRYPGPNNYGRTPYHAPTAPPGFNNGPRRGSGPEGFANFTPTTNIAEIQALYATPKYVSDEQWLGHPAAGIVTMALSKCNIPVSNKKSFDVCKACCLDLWGHAPTNSSNGYRYYISFVDAYSRYTWLYLLRTRDEALSTFTKFKTQVELQLGTKIKTLQSDWGGEFRSFTNMLETNGIVHKLACPLTHEQNGKPKALSAVCEPKIVRASLLEPHWNNTMNIEYVALKKNKTWVVVPRPANRVPIGCKWIFRVKLNEDGSVNRYKARLLAKGFHQQAGFDFSESFIPVVKVVTIQVVLTVAITNEWTIRKLDINNDFLNGDLHEKIYMEQPPGFVDPKYPNYVYKLNKALYGLKQAPRAWFEKLSNVLVQHGFQFSKANQSLFLKYSKTSCIYILAYVDDILVKGSDDTLVNQLIEELSNTFSLKDLSLVDYFSGIQVTRTSDGILLPQTKYLQELLCKADMQNYATVTRPDLVFCVNKVCQYLHQPLISHWTAVKRILRYVAGTLDYGLMLKPVKDFSLEVFCDVDWAFDPDDRRSATEFRSLASAVSEVTWLQSLLHELHITCPTAPSVWCDNQSTVLLAANPVLHARLKPIEIDLYFVRDKVLQNPHSV